MKIGQTPNISDNLTCSSVKKQEVRYSFGSKNSAEDCFVSKNRKKANFFSNFLNSIKHFFARPKIENTNEQIDISTLNDNKSAVSFKGISLSQTKTRIAKELGLSEKEISDYLTLIGEKSSFAKDENSKRSAKGINYALSRKNQRKGAYIRDRFSDYI